MAVAVASLAARSAREKERPRARAHWCAAVWTWPEMEARLAGGGSHGSGPAPRARPPRATQGRAIRTRARSPARRRSLAGRGSRRPPERRPAVSRAGRCRRPPFRPRTPPSGVKSGRRGIHLPTDRFVPACRRRGGLGRARAPTPPTAVSGRCRPGPPKERGGRRPLAASRPPGHPESRSKNPTPLAAAPELATRPCSGCPKVAHSVVGMHDFGQPLRAR